MAQPLGLLLIIFVISCLAIFSHPLLHLLFLILLLYWHRFFVSLYVVFIGSGILIRSSRLGAMLLRRHTTKRRQRSCSPIKILLLRKNRWRFGWWIFSMMLFFAKKSIRKWRPRQSYTLATHSRETYNRKRNYMKAAISMIKDNKKDITKPKAPDMKAAQIPPQNEFVEYIDNAINIWGFLAPGISSHIFSSSSNFSEEIL